MRQNMSITRYPPAFGCYRYRLRVEFTDQDDQCNGGNLTVIMLNPATTQEERDLTVKGHHTRQRLIKFARDSGYRTMTEIDLFAYRSRNKPELLKAVREQGIDPVGPENDQVISQAVQEADRVVVAWGVVANHPVFAARAQQVAELLKGSGKQVYCLEKNKDGSPKHPVRGRYAVQEWP